jgi:hypothetical protein
MNMNVTTPKIQYVLQHRGTKPPTFFPEGYDQSNLVEVSTIADPFAIFLNLETGEEIRCEDFHKKAMMEYGK